MPRSASPWCVEGICVTTHTHTRVCCSGWMRERIGLLDPRFTTWPSSLYDTRCEGKTAVGRWAMEGGVGLGPNDRRWAVLSPTAKGLPPPLLGPLLGNEEAFGWGRRCDPDHAHARMRVGKAVGFL